VDFAALIRDWGYLAVFAGAFLEGETVLAMAGYAAHEGLLDFGRVVALALVAGFLGDQFFFYVGRLHGRRIVERFPALATRAAAFDAKLARVHAPLIVMVRFMYGFRVAGPIFLGMGRVKALTFLAYNFLGACLWAPLVAGAGWFFGQAIEALLEDAHRYQLAVLGAIAVAGAATWWWHRRRP
jgi:membrane protein DedA with SNARE-associated domain